MKQLTEKEYLRTIRLLKTDPKAAIRVKDVLTDKDIVTKATNAVLTAEYGSVERFFEYLNNEGFDVSIEDQVPNQVFPSGLVSYKKRPGDFKVYSLKFPKETSQPKQEQIPTNNHNPMPQNNNNNQMQGLLGGLNMMDVSYKVQDHTRLMEDNNRLRVENEALKEKNTELKEKILEDRFDASKSKGNTDMFKELVPLLAPLLTKTMGGGAAAGLGSPVAQLPEMSHVKSSFIAMVHQMDDDFITDLIMISKGMQIEAFDDELTELIKKHNIQ